MTERRIIVGGQEFYTKENDMTKRSLFPFYIWTPVEEQRLRGRINRLSRQQQENLQRAELSKSKNFRDHFRQR